MAVLCMNSFLVGKTALEAPHCFRCCSRCGNLKSSNPVAMCPSLCCSWGCRRRSGCGHWQSMGCHRRPAVRPRCMTGKTKSAYDFWSKNTAKETKLDNFTNQRREQCAISALIMLWLTLLFSVGSPPVCLSPCRGRPPGTSGLRS